MALYSIEESTMRDIADAVKEKTGDESILLTQVGAKVRKFNVDTFLKYLRKELTEVTEEEADAILSVATKMFQDQTLLHKVAKFNDEVTEIPSNAFQNCTSLTDIILPNFLTKLNTYCFKGCSSLEHISFPETLTNFAGYCFEDCTSLNNVELPPTVSIGEYSFRNCSSLEELVAHTVSNIGTYAFARSGIRSFKADGVSRLGKHAFEYCNNLTEVELTGTLKLVDEYAFSECSEMTKVKLPDTVTKLNASSFTRCGSKNGFDMAMPENLVEIYSCFYETGLKELVTPSSLTTISGGQVFRNSKHLSLVDLSKSTKLTTIPSMCFYTCSKLKRLAIPESLTNIGSDAFSGAPIESPLIIPPSLTSIGTYAFSGNYIPQIHFTSSFTKVNQATFTYGSNAYEKLFDDPTTGVFVDDISTWLNLSYYAYAESLLYLRKFLYVNNERVLTFRFPEGVTELKQGKLKGFHGHTVDLSQITKVYTAALSGVYLDELRLPSHTVTWGSGYGGAGITRSSYIKKLIVSDGYASTGYTIGTSNYDISGGLPKFDSVVFESTSVPSNFANAMQTTAPLVLPEHITDIGSAAFNGNSSTAYQFGSENAIIIKAKVPPTIASNSFYRPNFKILIPIGSYDLYSNATNWSDEYVKPKLQEDARAGTITPEPLPTPKFTKAGQDLLIYETAHATSATIEYATSAEGPWSLFKTVTVDPAFGQVSIGYSTWWYTMESLGLSEAYLRVKTSVEGADDSAYSETVFLTRPGATQQFPDPVIALNSGDLMIQAASKIDTVTLYWRYTNQPNDELSEATTITLGSEDTVYESGGTYFHYPDDFYEPSLSAILRNTGGPVGGDSVDLYVTVNASGYTESELSNPVTFTVSYES